MRTRIFVAAALGMALTFAPQAHAQAIIGAASAVINIGGPGFGNIADTHNQAGLNAVYTSGVTDFASFVASTTHSFLAVDSEWFSNNPSRVATVTYDLGSVMSIDAFALWNEDGAGIGRFNLLGSSNGVGFSALLTGLAPLDNPLNSDYGAEVFAFAAQGVRFLRLEMSECPQPNGAGIDECSIGEVAFRSASTAVPEPGTYALMLAGLVGLGVVARRRRTMA